MRVMRIASRKAQITVFVIIGVIIISVFSLLYYLSNLSYSSQSPEKVVDDIIASTSVQKYFDSCLSVVSETGLSSIEQQGGFIFRDQKGSILGSDIETEIYNGTRITYQIFNPPSVVSELPQYPCFKNQAKACNSNENYCCFNKNDRVYIFGKTRALRPNLCKNSSILGECSPGQSNNNPFSIQEQLEEYINRNVKDCLNLTQLKEDFGYDFSYSNISSDVLISDTGIRVILTMPIKVVLSDGKPVLRRAEFSNQKSSKIKQFHKAAEILINKDNSEISFNISKPESSFNLPIGMSVKTVNNINKKNDSLVMMQDISGEKFQFMRQNRKPALDYISDLIISPGETLEIIPSASDPDEQKINYKFTTNYDTWKSEIENSQLYKNGDSFRGIPKNTGISFIVNKSDVGDHTITAYASDGTGYVDYQNVDVTVVST